MNPETTSSAHDQHVFHAPGQAPPSGVKGWLLFLCIWLVILGPIGGILSIIGDWKAFAPFFEDVPNLNVAVEIDLAQMVCITVFSVYAGCALWSRASNAVSITRIFLIFRAQFFLSGPLLFVAIAKLPSKGDFLAHQMMRTNAIGGLIASVAWYLYLKLSDRVANTYHTDNPVRAAR